MEKIHIKNITEKRDSVNMPLHNRRKMLLSDGRRAPIPRYSEIEDSLCELIRKQLGLK
jgi:hypothetical protein